MAGASALALLTAAGAAGAQTAAGPGAEAGASSLSEVVVTATRRGEQNVQNIPMAIEAFSGPTLDRYNIKSIDDLGKIDPSVSVQHFGAIQQQIIIRGISSNTGQTTGVYLDEAPLQGGFNTDIFGDNIPGLRLHDVDHIEVLKGPQGTLFGAGSMDGTLRVVTVKPKFNQVEGMVEGTLAGVQSGNAYEDGDAVLNIPIVNDKVAARAVAWGESGGGFIDQYIAGHVNKDVNDEHMYGGRLSVLVNPTPRLSILGAVNYQSTVVDGSGSWTLGLGATAEAGGPEQGPFPPYENHSPSLEPYHQRYMLSTITAQYDLGFGSIIATSSYGTKDELQLEDTTPSDCSYFLCSDYGDPPATYSPHVQFHNATEEIRFSSNFQGPFQIVAGGYFERDAMLYDGAVISVDPATGAAPCDTYASCDAAGLNIPGVNPATGIGNSAIQFASEDHFTVKQYTVYGQADYKIFDNLTLTVGARYFAADLDDKQINQQSIYPDFFEGVVDTPSVTSQNHSHETKPTFNFAVLWAATPDVSFYARASSGFRIGGINQAATIASQEGIPVPAAYGPDSLWDYEAGAKIYLLDRRLYLDMAGYHIDWDGEQETALANGVYSYTLNVGKTTVNGGEFSATYKPVPDLTLQGSISYVDAQLAADFPTSVTNSGYAGVKGDRAPYVPHVTFAGRADYQHPISDSVVGYAQTDFKYRSDEYTAFAPTTAEQLGNAGAVSDFYTRLPPYFLLDLRAGVRWDRYDVSLFMNNVTNKAAWAGAQPKLDAIRIFSPPPRTFGVHLTAHF
ncbi:MAG: TonB-dependent receptor [Caulobacteraceae bacterium]